MKGLDTALVAQAIGQLRGTELERAREVWRRKFDSAPRDAAEVNRRVFLAGLRRRRPAIMTNATTMLSLIPVLWATGRGSEVMQPMVLPIVGGMIFDVISLFSVPVFFTWYWERRLAREAANRALGAPAIPSSRVT